MKIFTRLDMETICHNRLKMNSESRAWDFRGHVKDGETGCAAPCGARLREPQHRGMSMDQG